MRIRRTDIISIDIVKVSREIWIFVFHKRTFGVFVVTFVQNEFCVDIRGNYACVSLQKILCVYV